jgi:hypothetical protein
VKISASSRSLSLSSCCPSFAGNLARTLLWSAIEHCEPFLYALRDGSLDNLGVWLFPANLFPCLITCDESVAMGWKLPHWHGSEPRPKPPAFLFTACLFLFLYLMDLLLLRLGNFPTSHYCAIYLREYFLGNQCTYESL